MQSFWNQRYTEEEAAYGKAPNAFLAEALGQLRPQWDATPNLLLPCDGEGRNAVWAAGEGWNVSSFDYSDAGVRKAQQWATEAGVTIDCQVADAHAFVPNQPADVVALIFAHMPADLRAAFHKRAATWVQPGGFLILEGFHPDQIHHNHPSGGPKQLDMLFTPTLLRKDFEDTSGLKILSLEAVETTLDEGPFHRGSASVVRMIAQKPVEA